MRKKDFLALMISLSLFLSGCGDAVNGDTAGMAAGHAFHQNAAVLHARFDAVEGQLGGE